MWMLSNVVCTEEISKLLAAQSTKTRDFQVQKKQEEKTTTLKQAAEYLLELGLLFCVTSNNWEMLINIEKMESCIVQSVVLNQTQISDYLEAQ